MLLLNFLAERSIYEADIKEVLAVELYLDEWLNVNGVDGSSHCFT